MWRKKKFQKCDVCGEENFVHVKTYHYYNYAGHRWFDNTKLCYWCRKTVKDYYIEDDDYDWVTPECGTVLKYHTTTARYNFVISIVTDFLLKRDIVIEKSHSKDMWYKMRTILNLYHGDSNSYFSWIPIDIINLIVLNLKTW